jgi:hypothetical protein
MLFWRTERETGKEPREKKKKGKKKKKKNPRRALPWPVLF